MSPVPPPIRGAVALIDQYAAATAVDTVAIDTGANPRASAIRLSAHVALQFNLDLMAWVADDDALLAETDAALAVTPGRRHNFDLGQRIMPSTRPAYVSALVDRIRAA